MPESTEQPQSQASDTFKYFDNLITEYNANVRVHKYGTTEEYDALVTQMVELTSDKFLATPPQGRLDFIRSFRHDHFEMHEGVFPPGRQGTFFDKLIVRIAEKLENPQI